MYNYNSANGGANNYTDDNFRYSHFSDNIWIRIMCTDLLSKYKYGNPKLLVTWSQKVWQGDSYQMFFRFFTLIFFALIRKSRILILNSRIFQYFQRWWGASMLWVVLVLFESNIETCQWEWTWVHGKAFPLIHKQRSQTSLCQRLSRHFQLVQKTSISAFSSLQLKSCNSF